MDTSEHKPVTPIGVIPKAAGTVSDVVAKDAAPVDGAVSAAATLADIAAEFELFTHALMFTHGFMQSDPLTHYTNTRAPGLRVLVLEATVPLFHALPQYPKVRHWAYKLFGCPKADWPALHAYLSGVSGVHRDMQLFWRAGSIVTQLPDFLAMHKAAVLSALPPTVPITTYAVGRSDATFLFGVVPPDIYPRVLRQPAQPDIVRIGQQVLAADQFSSIVEDTDGRADQVSR